MCEYTSYCSSKFSLISCSIFFFADPASGGSVDWVKATFGTPLVYVYELRDKGKYGFILPPDQIIPSSLETLDSILTIFKEYEASTHS